MKILRLPSLFFQLFLVLVIALGGLTIGVPGALAIATLDNFPTPNIDKTEKILGPAGGIF